MVAVAGPEGGELLGRTCIGEAAARRQVREHHDAARIEDLGRLGHEVNAAEHDHIGFGAGGAAGELERITNHIGDVLDGVVLVVMGQDHGVPLTAQGVDRGGEIGRGRGHQRRDGGLGLLRCGDAQPGPRLGQDVSSLRRGRLWACCRSP